jgi:molybdopterin molybdotransferase
MISFDEAIAIIGSVATPLGSEMVALEQSAGRVLAAPVIARIDSPRAAVSAMDGYAVSDADLAKLPVRLKVIGESFAGAGWSGSIGPGSCARIFTGAPVPAGGDRVVMQEMVRRDGDFAVIEIDPGASRHIRARASDFAAGDILLDQGRRLDPRAIVAAAAADLAELELYRRPRVHILSTGDELAPPGSAAGQRDSVPESVSFGVAALAEQWGGECLGRTRLGDNLHSMQSAAAEMIGAADLVVVTGGASVGEKDFAKAMFEPLGLELLFSRVAIKPGKPVWLGRVAGKFVMGLPGNPTSALVTARLMLAPLIARLTGQSAGCALCWRSVPLHGGLDACGDRETFHRAQRIGPEADILSFQDSGAQKALAQADLLVRQPPNSPPLAAGDAVQVLDF